MTKKKPLEERLAACGSRGGRYPAAFWLDTLCYFQTLSDLRGDAYYADIYNSMAVEEAYQVSDSFVAQLVAKAYAGALPEPVCREVLYRILIEPFCDKNLWKRRKK
jgi:hypothetical protein